MQYFSATTISCDRWIIIIHRWIDRLNDHMSTGRGDCGAVKCWTVNSIDCPISAVDPIDATFDLEGILTQNFEKNFFSPTLTYSSL